MAQAKRLAVPGRGLPWRDEPDYRLGSVADIEAGFCSRYQITHLFLDADGTLCPWDSDRVPLNIAERVCALRRDEVAGVYVVSNTVLPGWREREERVARIASQVGADCYHCATWPQMKPASRPFQLGLTYFDVAPGRVLMVGDQRRKDVRGANALGLQTALVDGLGGEPGWLRALRRLSGA